MATNNSMIKFILAALTLIATLTACSPVTKFWATSDFQGERITSQNILTLKKINIDGDLKGRNTDLFPLFKLGFNKQNNSINLVDVETNSSNYTDLELLLNLSTKSSVSALEYVNFVPVVGVYTKILTTGDTFDFYWDVKVDYEFRNPDGMSISRDSFDLKGLHRYKPDTIQGLAMIGGMGPIVAMYPRPDAQKVVGDTLLPVVGEEIAKRLSGPRVKTYLAQREKQRDGMDVKTYVEFLEQKKRLEKERTVAKAERLKDLDVKVKSNDKFADIKQGSVMVLGIGVSKYQSAQIPTLKYADRDSRRVVQLFKDKYKLSNDRAMLLTNEDATAIKISRFITQSAAKLLSADDTFILYFGGHGAPDVDAASNDSDGLKKYLLLHDTELDSLPMTGLSLNNLATLLEKLPCKRVVILLDSCFSGTAGGQTLAKLKSVRISDKSYKNITDLSGEGRVILAASSENQVSHEEDSLQAGVFTHYLIEGLNGKAKAKDDGSINILSLYEYVNKEVSRYTKNKQSPVFRGTLDANIIF